MTQTPYTGAVQNRLNTLSIVAIIGGFVMPIVGVIVGIIALRQIKQTGERGHGLALGGVIVGAALIVIYLLVIIISAVAGAVSYTSY